MNLLMPMWIFMIATDNCSGLTFKYLKLSICLLSGSFFSVTKAYFNKKDERLKIKNIYSEVSRRLGRTGATSLFSCTIYLYRIR